MSETRGGEWSAITSGVKTQVQWKKPKNVGKLKVGKKYEVQVRTKNSVSPGKVAGLKFKAKK